MLTPAERNYSQLDKEGLAIVFEVKKFHQYLYGQKFSIITDHKPLLGLFGSKCTPTTISPRVQCWILTSSGYEYSIHHRPGVKHGIANAVSRLPIAATLPDPPMLSEVLHLIEHFDGTIVTSQHIKSWPSKDPVMSKVRLYTSAGWPQEVNDELSLHDGCVLWGAHVCIPPQGRMKILDELHEMHPGISKMKALARTVAWWPGIDKDIESRVKECSPSQETQNRPVKAPLNPWEWPCIPWTRLHIDYAEPSMGKMFLVLVDAISKWLEVEMVDTATSASTIERLRKIFATHGVPKSIVSDNGSVFTSEEMKKFSRRTTSATFAPPRSTHHQMEWQRDMYKLSKKTMQKLSTGTLQTKLSRLFFQIQDNTTDNHWAITR